MDLSRLVEARQTSSPPPTWSAMFIMPYFLVASRTPILRTSYMKFPWPRFYEHPINIATLNVDRQVRDERVVLQVHMPEPETRSLQELGALIHDYQELPVENIDSYRTAVHMSRVPRPLRPWLWWGALNVFGATRCHHFGTFCITSVGAHGSGTLHLPTLLTSTIHYGIIGSPGELAMRLSFDHRVLDVATAAQALEDLEDILLGEIVREYTLSIGTTNAIVLSNSSKGYVPKCRRPLTSKSTLPPQKRCAILSSACRTA
jgi:hypothetical protein